MKIGICTDSGSGITPEEGKRLGITVVPMPFRMGEEEYFEDINMSREEFFKRLLSGESVSTSQPAMKSVLEAWDRLVPAYPVLPRRQLCFLKMNRILEEYMCRTAGEFL